jgi:ABC-type Fe3+ transport system substrate-binding protein
VPAGKYGKAALEKLEAWGSVESAVARTENVRGALLLVSRHEAPLGIVYATDVAADPGVKIAGVFPPETHPPIVYPIALTADSRDPAAGRLLDFLTSPAARPIFEKHGFTRSPERMSAIPERSVAEIRLLELVKHPAQLHQHRPHELLLRLVAEALADDLVQRLPGLRQQLE